MIMFNSKEAFIAALQERRAFWHDYDERRTIEHKAQEEMWLNKARATLRSRLEWGYDDWKKGDRYSGSVALGSFPECPVLMEAQLDSVLSVLKLTQSKLFRVTRDGVWGNAHKLLTWDPYAPKTVC